MNREEEPMKKGVIWDVDGVLADTAPFHYQGWRRVWEEKGIDFSYEAFRETFGMRNDEVIRRLLGKSCSEEEIELIGNRKETYFRQVAKGRIKPLPGLVELLKSLQKDSFNLAVASSGPRENIESVLRECKITEFFNALVSGREVSHSKPHPEIFLVASRRIDIPPSHCVVVEDSLAGIEGAKRAGMKCIAVTTTHPPSHFTRADMVIENFRNLKLEDFNRLIQKK